MPQDSHDPMTQDAIIRDVHAAIEKILLLDDRRAMALIRETLSQLSAIVADIAVLGKDAATMERASEEFHDLMIEISVLSMQLKAAQRREQVIRDLLAAAGVSGGEAPASPACGDHAARHDGASAPQTGQDGTVRGPSR